MSLGRKISLSSVFGIFFFTPLIIKVFLELVFSSPLCYAGGRLVVPPLAGNYAVTGEKMEQFLLTKALIPEEGYTWVDAYVFTGGSLSKRPVPCLVMKGWEKLSTEGVLAQRVEVDETVNKKEEPAYLSFYRLYFVLQEKGQKKFMDTVLKFANRYGNIVEAGSFIVPQGSSSLPTLGVPLSSWETEVYNFWNCYELFQLLNQPGKLGQHVVWDREGVFFKYFGRRGILTLVAKDKKSPPQFHSFTENPKGGIVNYAPKCYLTGSELIADREGAKRLGFEFGEVVAPARYYLTHKIEKQLKKGSSLTITRDGKLAVTFSGTLSLVWFQFAQLFAETRRVITCRYCGLPVDITGKRSDTTGHESCRKRHNMRVYRERKKRLIQKGREAIGDA